MGFTAFIDVAIGLIVVYPTASLMVCKLGPGRPG